MAMIGEVRSAAFSPDGSRIVTASADNTARIWDAATAKEIAVLRGYRVNSAAFSPDGSRIVTARGRCPHLGRRDCKEMAVLAPADWQSRAYPGPDFPA